MVAAFWWQREARTSGVEPLVRASLPRGSWSHDTTARRRQDSRRNCRAAICRGTTETGPASRQCISLKIEKVEIPLNAPLSPVCLPESKGTAMTIGERINSFITEHRPNAFCDDCITEHVRLSSRQHAQYVTDALATTDYFQRVSGTCSVCGSKKKVINRA